MAEIVTGTKTIFRMTTPPLYWTKDTTNYNEYTLRVVSGSTSTGGSQAFSAAFTPRPLAGPANTVGTMQNTVITYQQIPQHQHQYARTTAAWPGRFGQPSPNPTSLVSTVTQVTSIGPTNGTNTAHTHPTGDMAMTWTPSGDWNIAVQYVDVITATKD
jgi:hypothetical protein